MKHCLSCGREFRAWPSNADRAKYCSKECKYQKYREQNPRQLLYRLYQDQKLGMETIGHILGVNPSRVYYWLNKYGIPRRSHEEAVRVKYGAINLNPTPELAYIAGVVWGDGTTCACGNGKYVVGLQATRREFVEAFRLALIKLGFRADRVCEIKSPRCTNGRVYSTYCRCKPLYLFLRDESKVVELAHQYPIQFLKGFYESEGTLVRTSTSVHCKVSNTKYRKAALVWDLIEKLGFKCKLSWDESIKCYHVRILGGRAEVKRFLTTISPCIKGWEELQGSSQ